MERMSTVVEEVPCPPSIHRIGRRPSSGGRPWDHSLGGTTSRGADPSLNDHPSTHDLLPTCQDLVREVGRPGILTTSTRPVRPVTPLEAPCVRPFNESKVGNRPDKPPF